jgi:predicted DNA-binding protein with PD1-like motif
VHGLERPGRAAAQYTVAMKFHLVLLAALVAGALTAESLHTRTEVIKPTSPQDDSKPNSDKVPEVYAIDGQFDRIVVLRFKFQSDLLGGIEKMVKEHNIRNAVILAGIGSLRNYHVHSVSNRDFPSKNIYIKDTVTPADIISINGYIIDGRIHAHMTLTDGEKAYGGHIEPQNNVFTFAILTLGVFSGKTSLDRVDDKTYR